MTGCERSRSSNGNGPATPKIMLSLMLGTFILALTYAVFWHNQPARRQSYDKGCNDFRFGPVLTRVLAWLLVMPHLSYSVEQKDCVLPNGKGVEPSQTLFLRQVCAMRGEATRNRTVSSKKSDVVPRAGGRNHLWERIASALVPVLARRG